MGKGGGGEAKNEWVRKRASVCVSASGREGGRGGGRGGGGGGVRRIHVRTQGPASGTFKFTGAARAAASPSRSGLRVGPVTVRAVCRRGATVGAGPGAGELGPEPPVRVRVRRPPQHTGARLGGPGPPGTRDTRERLLGTQLGHSLDTHLTAGYRAYLCAALGQRFRAARADSDTLFGHTLWTHI